MVDKRLESIYLLDEIEVCMKRVSDISNVTVVQKEKIVTGGPPIILHSLSTAKFCDSLDSEWLKSFYPREDPPVFCNFYLL